MRKLVFIALLFVSACVVCITFSCANRPEQGSEDTLAVDTTSQDSLEAIISETPMPKSADELFDDFIFNFAANRKLQMERIQFPLTVTGEKSTRKIEKSQWHMERFFMRQDFYTLLFDNQKQKNVVKDTTVNHTVVEKIYLEKNAVKQYVFDRINGEWKLTSINNTNFKGSINGSFLTFYNKFVNDSTFQMSSINDPLYFTGPDPDDDFSTMEGQLLPEQWPVFAPPLPKGMIYNIIYGNVQGKDQNHKILVVRGIANGMEDELTFIRKSGKWYLTRINR